MRRLLLLSLLVLPLTSCSSLVSSLISSDSSNIITSKEESSLVSTSESSSIEDISTSSEESSDSTSSLMPKEIKKALIFTEVVVSKSVSNRAFEITNILDETVDLNDYEVRIYRQYSETPTHIIPLTGYLEPLKPYVVVYDEAGEVLLSKANLVTNKLINDGTWAMGIYSLNDELNDILGTIGFVQDYAYNKDLVRKKEYFGFKEAYRVLDYIAYPQNDYSHLGNLDVISEAELLEGPKLTDEDFVGSFVNVDKNCGTGKAIKTTLKRTIDGDTSHFDYGSTYSSSGISGQRSTRYYGVNTPEIAHSSDEEPDPYGNEARDYTNNKLRNAQSIALQSIKNASLTDNYDRMLMYVWISDKKNAEAKDYVLLNLLIIKDGFSNVSFVNSDAPIDDMLYRGVSYVSMMRHAEEYSRSLKLNIHSNGQM